MELRTDELRQGMRVRPMTPRNAAERVPFVFRGAAPRGGRHDLYVVHDENRVQRGSYAGRRIWLVLDNEETPDMAATTAEPKKATAAEEKKIKLREEIAANTERVQSLAEADNAEAVKALCEETDALIAQLPTKERNPLRVTLGKAAEAKAEQPEPPKAEVATLGTQEWTDVEGAQELVDMGAAKVVESVALNIKTADYAKDLASILFDLRYRMDDKEGKPDLDAKSDPAKKAAKALYASAGSQLKGDPFEVKKAVDGLKRAVQYQMTEVRSSFLRALDAPDADLSRFGRVLENKPADAPVSEYLAKVYGLALKGQKEIDRERFLRKLELEGGSGKGQTEGGEGSTQAAPRAQTSTPDERVTKSVTSLMSTFRTASPEDFDAASDETKAKVRAQLEQAKKALNDMLARVL